jgi:hypothetical protein
MFKWFFRHEDQHETAMNRKSAIRQDLAMRASIASKLRKYNPDEDTTTSNFTLADDAPVSKPGISPPRDKNRDPWGQANPRETGKWNKENRKSRIKKTTGVSRR